MNIIESMNSLDKNNENALFKVIRCKLYDVAIAIIGLGVNVNQLNKDGQNVLFLLGSHYIYNKDAESWGLSSSEGEVTLKEYDVNEYMIQMVNLLVERGININQVDDYGCNAFFTAWEYENGKLAKVLLDNGIDTSQVNNIGRTVFWKP